MLTDKTEANDSGYRDSIPAHLNQEEAQFRVRKRLMDHMVYHVRTLSNAIVGFSDLLLSEKLKPEQAEYVREIHEAGYGLSSLVNEVLDWTSLMSGQLVVLKTRCYLPGLIGRLEKILASAANEKGLDYKVSLDPRLPAVIHCDSEYLFKCLLNLVSNAIQHTRQGSVQFCVRLQDDAPKSVVCFDVIDTGGGMEPEKIERIFDIAWATEESEQEVLTLFNLGYSVTAGLPLTKQLCQALGGTLEVTSQLQVGSTFSLRIPAGVNLAAESAVGTSAPAPLETPGPKTSLVFGSILLAEDQPSNRTVLTLLLEALGAQVDTAQDGSEALEKSQQNAYDLILMDLKMPRMDGYEAARLIRQQNIRTPMVAMSAKVFNEGEQQQITALFDGFLAKPVDSRQLSEMLERFMVSFSRKTALDESAAACSTGSDEEDIITFEYGR